MTETEEPKIDYANELRKYEAAAVSHHYAGRRTESEDSTVAQVFYGQFLRNVLGKDAELPAFARVVRDFGNDESIDTLKLLNKSYMNYLYSAPLRTLTEYLELTMEGEDYDSLKAVFDKNGDKSIKDLPEEEQEAVKMFIDNRFRRRVNNIGSKTLDKILEANELQINHGLKEALAKRDAKKKRK